MAPYMKTYLTFFITGSFIITNASAFAIKGSAYVVLSKSGLTAPSIEITKEGETILQEYGSNTNESHQGHLQENSVAGGSRDEIPNFQDFINEVDCIILGRSAFEEMAQAGEKMWAKRGYGNKKTVVWTRNPSRVTENLPEFLRKRMQTDPALVTASSLSPKELFCELENEGYSHACIGGKETIKTFMQHGLVHNFHLQRDENTHQQMIHDPSTTHNSNAYNLEDEVETSFLFSSSFLSTPNKTKTRSKHIDKPSLENQEWNGGIWYSVSPIPSTDNKVEPKVNVLDEEEQNNDNLPIRAETTALLIVDVQPEYWSSAPSVRKDFPNFEANLARTIATARKNKCKIIWVRADYRKQHSPWLKQFERLKRLDNRPDTMVELPCDPEDEEFGWEDFATPEGGEAIIAKPSWSSTSNTALFDILRASAIDTVLVCGLITSVCVQHSAFGVFEAGYRTLLVEDACGDRGRARHEAALALYGGYMYELITSEDLLDPVKGMRKAREGNSVLRTTSNNVAEEEADHVQISLESLLKKGQMIIRKTSKNQLHADKDYI